jgi:hypothetical protein
MGGRRVVIFKIRPAAPLNPSNHLLSLTRVILAVAARRRRPAAFRAVRE